MSTPLPPTWASEDLPVLAAAIEIYDENGSAESRLIASKLSLPVEDVTRSLSRLDPDYVSLSEYKTLQGRRPPKVLAVTGNARRAAGQWPDPDKMTADIITQLVEAAGGETPEKERAITEFFRGATGELAGIGGTLLGSALRAYVGM